MTHTDSPTTPGAGVHFPVPEALAARPRAPRSGIPVPWVNEHDEDDGTTTIDFISINHERGHRCTTERLCGACGLSMGYWITFLGSPRKPELRQYTDPPMHEECALAALSLCPHIAIKRHRRAAEHRVRPDTGIPLGWDQTKPGSWEIGYTRQFTDTVYQGRLLFLPAPFKRIRTFTYTDNDTLIEVTPHALGPKVNPITGSEPHVGRINRDHA